MTKTEIPTLKDYSSGSLDQFFQEIKSSFARDVAQVRTPDEVEELRIRWVGRKQGLINKIGEVLKQAPMEAKKTTGQHFKELKEEIERTFLVENLLDSDEKLQEDAIDITLPGIRPALGAEHPLIRTMHEIVSVFERMGYSVGVGPEVETDYYNFESLNFPPNHPARDTQDTLVIAGQEHRPLRDRLLLRTHTSPV